MKVHYCTDYNEMSQLACDAIVSNLKKNQKQLICTATGNSPTATYEKLGDVYNDEPEIFNGLIITKLDEWGGIDSKEPNSCESYIQEKILQPLQIPLDRYISFKYLIYLNIYLSLLYLGKSSQENISLYLPQMVLCMHN